MPAGLTLQSISPQSLQGKTPEELTLLLIKLRRQQAELNSVRDHTLAQLMQLKLEAHSPKVSYEEFCMCRLPLPLTLSHSLISLISVIGVEHEPMQSLQRHYDLLLTL